MKVINDESNLLSNCPNTSLKVKMNKIKPVNKIPFSTIIGYFLPLVSSRPRIVVAASSDKLTPTCLGRIISILSHVVPNQLQHHLVHYDDSKMHRF